jgi:hypothetical protein
VHVRARSENCIGLVLSFTGFAWFAASQHAVQGGLVGNGTLQERVAVLALGVQGGERAPHHPAHIA